LAVHFYHILKYPYEFKLQNEELTLICKCLAPPIFAAVVINLTLVYNKLGLEKGYFSDQNICSDEPGYNTHSEYGI